MDLNLCITYNVTIDPPHIKIENKVSNEPKYITLIFNANFEMDVKIRQLLKLEHDNTKTEIICHAAEENKQDKDKKNKIIFEIDQNQFINKTKEYGKYKLIGISINLYFENNISYEQKTILIFLNYIKFKNPLHAYELTADTNESIQIKYGLTNEIQKEYIYSITYTDDSNINNETKLNDSDYNIVQIDQKNLNLIIKFTKKNIPKNYTFYIYPEYDRTADKSGVPKVYLHFQDYLLLTDAIYVKRNYLKSSLVYFKAQIRYKENIETFSINDNSGIPKFKCDTLEWKASTCSCIFKLGNKGEPGKLTVEYVPKNTSQITQKREIFLILYETSMIKCYKNTNDTDLELYTYWTSEMEYEHFLYFNDTARKELTQYEKTVDDNPIKVNLYTAKSTSLNSGTFSIYSSIPELTTNLNSFTNTNPVDDYSLSITVFPGISLEVEPKNTTIYTRTNSDQIIQIDSSNAPALDELTLKKISNYRYQIVISKSNGQCTLINENTFTCNLKNVIYNYGQEYEGDYYVYYKSPCDKNDLMIKNRIVIIERGINLISLTPTYFFQNEVIGKEITLQYDNNANGKINRIGYMFRNNSTSMIVPGDFFNNFTYNNDFITIKLNKDLGLGIYYIASISKDNNIINNYNLYFRVIQKITDFKFNHHYFVLNNNAQTNRLIIKVNDTTNSFGCMIEEATRNKNLTEASGDCKTFHYDIYRTGQIYFNYYYNDNKEKILIPISDSIIVASTYTSFFDFSSLKNCYYYKYNISMTFYNKMPKYFVFLHNQYRNISLISNEENPLIKYTYNKTNISSEYIINQQYYLIISEEYQDNEIYLYKSTDLIGFTDIEVPEFIIKPNLTVTFHNIFCNLDKSIIEMKKYNENSLSRQISDCKYSSSNKIVACNIKYSNFYDNNPFGNYSYTIDNEDILDKQNKHKVTFVSNKLSDSLFNCNYNVNANASYINVKIININCDFYFKILSEVGYYKIVNGKNDSNIQLLQRNGNNQGFNIDETICSLDFQVMENEMFDLDINYIKRNNYSWEGYMGLSIFHFFNDSENHIFNNTIFQVEPTLFIYNNYSLQKDSFKLKIIFKDINLFQIYKANTFRNLSSCTVGMNTTHSFYECIVDSSSLKKNQAENFIIYIKDNQVNLDFIFYELDPKSKQCKTKNEQIGDLTLLINIPNPKYKNLIYLNSESYMTINPPKRSDHQINYTLLGNEIDLSSLRFSINILGYENINEKFSLKDLGLTIIPFYYMKSKNDEKKILLLPDKDQTLTLDIFVKDNYIVDPNDIQYLGINGHNSNILIVNNNTINATFDLTWVENEIVKEYQLYYIDKCGITTYTNLTISVASFTVQRNYFVIDNNLDYMKTQRLIIYGPTGDYLRLFAYRGNSQEGILVNFNTSDNNYYLDFDQSSSGEYTFKIFNNGIELAKIVDIVYVALKLSAFFKYDNLPTCSFLDNNKEVLNDISYNIEIADINKIKNIAIFKTTLKSNDSFLLNFTEKIINDNKKAFFLNKTETLKEKISPNIEMFFYLTEKDYLDQPLYAFKLKYTNISLNSIASEVLYSDTEYIPLDMSCKIDNIDIFHLKGIDKNEEIPIQCENYLYDEKNNIYKCYLYENKENNPLLNLGDSNFNYGYYNLTYSNNRYLVSKKPFYLSHEILTVDFKIKKEEQIDINDNTNVKILLNNKIFYLPYIERVNYNDDKGMNNPLEAKFVYDFNSEEKYLSFNIFIEAKHTYIINEICRIPCDYCSHDDCWNNPDKYNVTSNTKNITFEFNRKYIALNNSTNQDNGLIYKELKIKIGGDDKEKLKEVIFNYMKNDGITLNNKTYNNWTNDEIIMSEPEVGKYEFNYTVKEEGKPDKTFRIKNRVVLVSNYDYEIFNLTELYKKCIYYDDIQGELYALITKNKSYIFQDYVNIPDLIIIMNNVEFEYNDNKLYKKFSSDTEFLNNKDYTIILKEKEHKELRLIFTKFEQEISVTSFDFSTTINYFYKDNIVTMNQTCDLDNIYIGATDYNSNLYYKLNCKYTDIFTKKSYCEADYIFTNIQSKEFPLFIGYPDSSDYFPINKSKLIYNSIKDSNFSLSYKEPNVTISSMNFNMTHINHVRIDDNITINSINFKQNISQLIQFSFYKSNHSSIKNYVKELVRNEHEEDRIDVIKNKLVNLEIIEKECGELLYNYLGACITCQTFSGISTENSDRKWFQDYDCVTRCDFDNGYGISSKESFICSKCEPRNKSISGEYLCGCDVDGTVKSFEDGNCYLPESSEIKKLLLIKPNAQCYLEDGTSTNYCNASNTEDCITYGNSGYLFPQCICKNGYSGKYCEFDNNNINEQLQEFLDDILSDENDEIDESNIDIISKIRGVTFFLEKDGLQYIQNIKEESINTYIQRSLKCLRRIVERTKNSTPQIYDVLNMAIFFLKYKITYQKLRSLQEDKDKDDLNYIMKYLHYANFYGNKDTEQDYNIQTNGLGIMSFIKYKNSIVDSDDFKQEMANTTEFKIMEYIKINTTKTKYIYVTLINNSYFDESSGNDDLGINVSFSTNESINVDDLSEIKELTFYISSLDIKFNFNLAQYYENKKIRIYNKTDKAFVEPCYLSKLFDYDLTQKYRKNNIYQKLYYGSQKCKHISFESKFNRLIFNCSEFDNVELIDNASDILYYGTFLINIEKDSLKDANKLVYNLPTKCINKIDDLGNNIAFWFFLIIVVIEFIYSIGINILNFGRLKKTSYSKAVENDEMVETYVIPYEKPIPHEDNEENNKKPYNVEFASSIIKNFFELHPLATLFRVSIISPLILNSWFFVYNMLSLFGFNALLYYEDLIEKRIYDKRRNNFAYPMRKEFHKILLSIIIQAILTTLLKFLVIVMLKDRNELKNNLGQKFNLKEKEFVDDKIVYRIDQFQKDMLLRRIIACIIMTFIIVFFFWYSVAFCGIYIKTQINWFYSGIWSLIWNWFILSPIYIIVITIIEIKKRDSFDPLVYNLKRLFCF